jgi:hypothetical protein
MPENGQLILRVFLLPFHPSPSMHVFLFRTNLRPRLLLAGLKFLLVVGKYFSLAINHLNISFKAFALLKSAIMNLWPENIPGESLVIFSPVSRFIISIVFLNSFIYIGVLLNIENIIEIFFLKLHPTLALAPFFFSNSCFKSN